MITIAIRTITARAAEPAARSSQRVSAAQKMACATPRFAVMAFAATLNARASVKPATRVAVRVNVCPLAATLWRPGRRVTELAIAAGPAMAATPQLVYSRQLALSVVTPPATATHRWQPPLVMAAECAPFSRQTAVETLSAIQLTACVGRIV